MNLLYCKLIDMTGGITEQFNLRKLSPEYFWNFWEILYHGFYKNSIIGCGLKGISNSEIGIIMGP